MGDQLRVFAVADIVVERWLAGQVPIPAGRRSARLLNAYRSDPSRLTDDERAVLYRRVLGRGSAPLPTGLTQNTDLEPRWAALLAAAADVIALRASNPAGTLPPVSPALRQATEQLRSNMSEHVPSPLHPQIARTTQYLRRALELLHAPEIRRQLGGPSATVWQLVAAIAANDLGKTVQIGPVRALAEAGRGMFRWIAAYDPTPTTDSELVAFLRAAEDWIVASAAIDPDDA